MKMEEKPQPQLDPKGSSSLWFYGRMFLLLLIIPIVPFLIRIFLEAAIWRYVFSGVTGIVFVGDLREALAISLTLQVLIIFMNLVLKVAAQAFAMLSGKTKAPDVQTKTLATEESLAALAKGDPRSTVRILTWRFLCTASVLAALCRVLPTHLAFASPLYLLGAAGLLTVVYYLQLAFLRETMVLLFGKIKEYKLTR